MKTSNTAIALVIAISGVSLGGCASLPSRIAHLFGRPTTVETRAIKQETKLSKVVNLASPEAADAPAILASSRADRFYDRAVTALKVRDYGRALDLLQLARSEAPDDVRVLNALGVTYDKLGRFDLSDRYYRIALAADPQSQVVRSNMRYSAMLQGETTALAAVAPQGRPSPAPAAPVFQAAPAFSLARAESVVRVQSPVLVGKPLMIINASGAPTLGVRLQAELADRGWSVVGQQVARHTHAGGAELRFPERHNAAAQALARTLPFPVELVACRSGCDGLTLTLGVRTKWKS